MSTSKDVAVAPSSQVRTRLAGIWRATRLFRPVLLLTVALFIVLAVTQDGFATWQNIQNLLTGVSSLWVVSVGMTFVLVTAGADLSVAAISALTGIFLAKIVSAGVPGWPAVVLTLVFGTIVGGVLNGLLVGRLRLSFFVVTLASMTALTGIVNLWSDTQSFPVDSPVTMQLGVNVVAGLPTPIWIMIIVFGIGLWLQRWTYFGRDVYAVGGSLAAARLSGVRTTRTLVAVYAISGFCATIGGIITVGRIGVAAPNVDATLPLQAIAAVLLGGTSLAGGSGGVGGTAIGVLFVGILQNGLSIAGVPSFWQQVITGIILVVAVLGDRLQFIREWLRRSTPLSIPPAPPGAPTPPDTTTPAVSTGVAAG